jgi:hypothetical protein
MKIAGPTRTDCAAQRAARVGAHFPPITLAEKTSALRIRAESRIARNRRAEAVQYCSLSLSINAKVEFTTRRYNLGIEARSSDLPRGYPSPGPCH